MKKILLALMLVISAINSKAQPWAAPGATWYYSYDNFNYTGYMKIQKTGDTLITGILCDRLERISKIKDLITNITTTYTLGYSYTYQNNNVVYLYSNPGFTVLYDFNAQPGISWTIYADYGWFLPCPPGTATIDSIGTTIINGTTLPYFFTSPFNPGTYNLLGQTIQKIGNLIYLLPQPDCLIDVFEAYGLRCYTDSSGWSYSTGLTASCDYITGINENNFTNQISVSPNPTSTEFQISNYNFQTGDELIFSDATGKILFTKKITTPTLNFKIQTLNFSNGIYFLQLKTKDGVVNKKVVVEH